MRFLRHVLALVSISLTILFVSAAHATGYTTEEAALSQVRVRAAPLTVSGNGEWVLYLDRNNILHRQHVHDPARTQSLPMPVKTSVLAASASGERVAFVAGIGCIGWVDFSSAGALAAGVHWMNGMRREAPAPDTGWASVPGIFTCNGGDAIALSQDGRLLATPSQLVELDTGKVRVNPLAIAGTVFRLQLVDHDSKLLVAHAILGQFYEGLADPSRLHLSVWDLHDQTPRRVISDQNPLLIVPEAFFVDFSPHRDTLYWVDTARYRRSRTVPGAHPAPLDVMQQPLAWPPAAPDPLCCFRPRHRHGKAWSSIRTAAGSPACAAWSTPCLKREKAATWMN
jgi:hypothetical protein